MDPLLLITNIAPTVPSVSHSRSRSGCSARSRRRAGVHEQPRKLDGVLHREKCRSIVVAGGDGSLHAVVGALYRRRELGGDHGP